MKNVLLLGATGTAGSALTQKLLSETDCHLTLFACHAREMYIDADRVSVIDGDAETVEALKAVMPGQDSVLCHFRRSTAPNCREHHCRHD
jgi:saccharopine dehydrogenase-like NADP-dependent oxidoreductase